MKTKKVPKAVSLKLKNFRKQEAKRKWFEEVNSGFMNDDEGDELL